MTPKGEKWDVVLLSVAISTLYLQYSVIISETTDSGLAKVSVSLSIKQFPLEDSVRQPLTVEDGKFATLREPIKNKIVVVALELVMETVTTGISME